MRNPTVCRSIFDSPATELRRCPEMPPLPRISFYVGINGQPQGPFDLAVLRNACQGGQYSATTLVWRKGMSEWKQMSEVPEFADIFEDCPPPLPRI